MRDEGSGREQGEGLERDSSGWYWLEAAKMWLPACWNETMPLRAQTRECVWLWRLVRPGERELYYTLQEFQTALTTFTIADAGGVLKMVTEPESN